MYLTKYDIDIFNDMHPEKGVEKLPGHWRAARLKRTYFCRLYTRFKELADAGYLGRDKPNTRKSKHSSWWRTRKADQYMLEKFGEPLPVRSRAGFEHQVLDDMDTASMQFGVDADDRIQMRFGKKAEIDFEFDGGNRPLELAIKDEHLFRFKEIDRNTEQGRATEKSGKRRTWTYKIRNILDFVRDRKKYGYDRVFVSIVTTSPQMKDLILAILKEELKSRHQTDCWSVGIATWKDWGNHNPHKGGEESYPKPTDHTFTVAYERVGHPPMYLNRFWEC